MLPWFSRTHKMSSFLWSKMYTRQLKFSSQKTLLSVQNRAMVWFSLMPCAYFSCLEELGLNGTSILHSPRGRCLSILVSLNACVVKVHNYEIRDQKCWFEHLNPFSRMLLRSAPLPPYPRCSLLTFISLDPCLFHPISTLRYCCVTNHPKWSD